MSDTLKSVLLSGLLFPGAGQIFLKRYKSGIVYTAITLVAISVFAWHLIAQASSILDKLLADGGPVDIEAISNLVHQTMSSADISTYHVLLTVIGLVWIVAVVDAYRVGRILEHKS